MENSQRKNRKTLNAFYFVTITTSPRISRNEMHRGATTVFFTYDSFVFTPKNAYAKDELVACGMGDLFGPGKVPSTICCCRNITGAKARFGLSSISTPTFGF